MKQPIALPEIETDTIPSPALIFFKERIRRNIDYAINEVGGAERLRPHVKSHKCPDVVKMKIGAGIDKFKCATLAEVRMLAEAGAKDVLLAYQPVGPNIKTLLDLIEDHPGRVVSCIVDHRKALESISSAASRCGIKVPVYIDFNVGMNRTGIQRLGLAVELAKQIAGSPGTVFKGIHAYDGHHTDPDPETRKAQAADTVKAVDTLKDHLLQDNIPVEEIVITGTPMFLQYIDYPHLTLSPGTLFLHDWTSFSKYADLKSEFGAMILSRVVSLPEEGIFTIDAGAKAVSVDYPAKAKLISYPDAEPGPMSEEHWRFTCKPGEEPEMGETVLLIPGHVCTAVHHYDNAYVINDNGKIMDNWNITARGRI